MRRFEFGIAEIVKRRVHAGLIPAAAAKVGL
jgi:hypothetical protein